MGHIAAETLLFTLIFNAKRLQYYNTDLNKISTVCSIVCPFSNNNMKDHIEGSPSLLKIDFFENVLLCVSTR